MHGDTILPQLEQSLPGDREGMQMSEGLVDSDLEFKSLEKKLASFGLHQALVKKRANSLKALMLQQPTKRLPE